MQKVRLDYFLSKMVVFLWFSFIFTNDSTYDYEPVGKEPDGWKEYVKMQYHENAKM